MAEHDATTPQPPPPQDERIPVMQEIFDNIWFLFLVAVIVLLVSYLAWGLIDLINVPALP